MLQYGVYYLEQWVAGNGWTVVKRFESLTEKEREFSFNEVKAHMSQLIEDGGSSEQYQIMWAQRSQSFQ